MIAEGIIFGLLAATFQSLSYIFTRNFTSKPGHRSTTLFALAHSWMGLFALALLPFVVTKQVLHFSNYAWPLAGAIAFYMAGQFCLFQAVKWTDASRISPLLGLKLLVLALICGLILRQVITPLQWLSVVLCLTAAVGLNYSGGGSLPTRSIMAVLGACVGYSLSDLYIVALVKALAPDGNPRGILLGTSLSYIGSSIIGLTLALSGDAENRTGQKWRAALPMAASWFIAMVFLFICFRLLDAVFGNIVQSMRGPISILMGTVIASMGHLHIESRVSKWVLARRLAAALLMCLAIAIFAHERARTGPSAPPALQPAAHSAPR